MLNLLISLLAISPACAGDEISQLRTLAAGMRQNAIVASASPRCDSQAVQKGMDPAQAAVLCAATPYSDAPVACYLAARARNVKYPEALALCQHPSSPAAPVSCYQKARDLNVQYHEALELCRETPSTDAPALCYAYARGRNVEYKEAIFLCKG